MIRPGIVMPKKLWTELKIQSLREEKTASDIIADLVSEYLKKGKKEGRK